MWKLILIYYIMLEDEKQKDIEIQGTNWDDSNIKTIELWIRECDKQEYIYDSVLEKIKDIFISKPNVNEIKNNSEVILISDFLNDIEQTKEIIQNLSSRGINGNIIQILDPAEITFPYKGRINFSDLEKEESILIGKAESLRTSYKKLITAHCNKIKKMALAYSWKYYLDTTDVAAESSLLKICNILSNHDSQKLDS